MFAKFCLSAVAATLITTVAAAATPREPAPVAPAPATVAVMPVIVDRGLSQRYCIIDDVTGSRLRRKECGSLAEWQVRGIDPRKMNRVSGWRVAGDR